VYLGYQNVLRANHSSRVFKFLRFEDDPTLLVIKGAMGVVEQDQVEDPFLTIWAVTKSRMYDSQH